LGLASYYRCFIKDFASIVRPLNDILKGENGKVSASRSKKIPVASDDKLLKNLKMSLRRKMYCSQDDKPITMISRTLKDRELSFATNERELLSIVWALMNPLYGVQNLNIFTDHR